MDAVEIEEELQEILKACTHSKVESVECIGDEGVIEICIKVQQQGKLTIEVESPWRILESDQIIVGSGTLAVCEENDIANVGKILRNSLVGHALKEYGFDDFHLHFEASSGAVTKLQQFSDFVSEDPEDYNIAFHWATESGVTHILVGPGSIYLTDAELP